ncbi:TerD family protein [Endozoicomonas ascidiicola]|uniref:TerD family protein n=1 Tax=Endozoicomonas ascidiicola TaxID=1698521 RepID=UPI00083763EA|nr:TerD family protein [Endozoicomonas ascidiicola]USN27012.1 TerD family protein [synthetic construct]
MAINLQKGGRINLEKEAPGLSNIHLGLGWDLRKTDGSDFDLDASILMLNQDDKAIGEGGFIFYNTDTSSCGSVKHLGDNRTGAGEGDDEVLTVDLQKVPDNVSKMLVAVTIHEGDERNQNFGLVDNAFVRVVNQDTGEEIARYDLTEDYSAETSLIFGELYKKDDSWRFAAKGDGFAGGLSAFLGTYGLGS